MDGGSTEDAGGGSFAGLGSLEGWRAPSKIAIWCLVLCGSLMLNATLLVAFIRRPGLRTISNRFVMNLIASNLLAAIVLTGLLITDSCGLSSLTSSGAPSLCALAEGAMAFVTTSSILSVLLIGVDQYLAVVDPLRYRTRIDKLKCALLILAVWLIALLFAGLASLNPQPRSLCWPSAGSDDETADQQQRLSFQASLLLGGGDSDSNSSEVEIEGEIRFEEEPAERNATAAASRGLGAGVTYGLIYALVYALLGYLVPFLAICWIYVSIYTAARSNSERTRRNGSRPMLSSGSFSEEPGSRPDASLEDFRRIPKISSLSSIDENSEACPSSHDLQQHQQQQQEPEEQTAVIFTVGSSQVQNAKDSTQSKVPIAALRAQFLQQDEEPPAATSSRFPEVSGQRRKSSHDLMYEEMMLGSKHPYEYDDEDEEEEDDESGHSSDEEQPPRHEEDCEEALPLSQQQQQQQLPENTAHSSTRSISVNFDLSEPHQPLKESHHQQQQQPPPIVTITPPGQKSAATSVPLQRAPSVKSNGHSYINNLKYRISNGSLFKYREETRAARISALVIVMGLICWTPYVYVLLSRNVPGLGAPEGQSSGLDATALGFLVLASYISPLLFGYRSRRVKRELRKFFCFKRELSYKNNRSLMAKKVLRRRHSGATILGLDASIDNARYNIFNCVYGRNRWPKEKVQFVQVPETALAVETCRSSFSSGASTQISSTSTDEC